MSAKSKTLSFNIQYAALQGVYWLTFCACVAFAAVYMQHRGYTNSVIGVTLALGNIIGVILSAVLASLADRRGRAGLFGALIGLLLAALAFQGIFILVRGASPLVLAGYCLYVACVNAGGRADHPAERGAGAQLRTHQLRRGTRDRLALLLAERDNDRAAARKIHPGGTARRGDIRSRGTGVHHRGARRAAAPRGGRCPPSPRARRRHPGFSTFSAATSDFAA